MIGGPRDDEDTPRPVLDPGVPVGGIDASSDALYRALVEQVPAVVYVDSHDQRPDSLYLSPQVRALTGFPASAFIADPELWRELTHAEDRPRIAGEWAKCLATESPIEMEYRMVRRDGAALWVRDAAVPVRDADGAVVAWQGIVRDITSSKRAEEALRESEARYRALVENIPAVVYMVAPDDDRRTLYVSPQIERTLGYTREEWLEQPDIWMELLHPDDREVTLAAHDEHNRTGESWSRDYRLIASDGRPVWFRDLATLVRDDGGRPLHWQGIQIDITRLKVVEEQLRAAREDLEVRVKERTAELEHANELMALEIGERRRAEIELRTAEQKYRALAEHIPGITYVWRTDVEDPGETTYTYVSPRIEQILGFTPEEWLSRSDFWMSRLHPDDRLAVLAAMLRSGTTGEPFNVEYRCLARDGHVVWLLDQAVAISRDDRGRPRAFQGVALDVTASKEAEAKARRSEARYLDLVGQIPAIIYVIDVIPGAADDLVTYVSPQLETILGYPPGAWTSSAAWIAAVHPDDRERVVAAVRRAEEGGEPYLLEYRVMHRDGHVVWVRDQGRTLDRDELGRPRSVQGLVIDVTTERLAADELLAAEEATRSDGAPTPTRAGTGAGPGEPRRSRPPADGSP